MILYRMIWDGTDGVDWVGLLFLHGVWGLSGSISETES